MSRLVPGTLPLAQQQQPVLRKIERSSPHPVALVRSDHRIGQLARAGCRQTCSDPQAIGRTWVYAQPSCSARTARMFFKSALKEDEVQHGVRATSRLSCCCTACQRGSARLQSTHLSPCKAS